jgi:type I site-specific restriction-modification system R (restriction) subunit
MDDEIKAFIDEQEASFKAKEKKELEESLEYNDWEDVREIVEILKDHPPDDVKLILNQMGDEREQLAYKFLSEFKDIPDTNPLKIEIQKLLERLDVPIYKTSDEEATVDMSASINLLDLETA